MKRLQPGMTVQHFKGEHLDRSNGNTCYLYKILGTAKHFKTEEVLVIYQALYTPYAMFVRSATDFLDKVDKLSYPNVKQLYKFEEFRG